MYVCLFQDKILISKSQKQFKKNILKLVLIMKKSEHKNTPYYIKRHTALPHTHSCHRPIFKHEYIKKWETEPKAI